MLAQGHLGVFDDLVTSWTFMSHGATGSNLEMTTFQLIVHFVPIKERYIIPTESIGEGSTERQRLFPFYSGLY